MKLSNFNMVKITGRSPLDRTYFAEVDVTTGFLWWKKTERLMITKEYAGYWHFVDTGKFCPDLQAEYLERSWTAKSKINE
jgi:hypothetical protein